MRFNFKRLRFLFPNRIWHQIFFVLIFMVVIPLVILGTLLITTSKRTIKTSVLRDYKQIAIHATGEVEQSIEGAKHALEVAASILGILQSDIWRQETTLVELALQYPAYRRVSSVDLNGEELATSELGTIFRDWSNEKVFKEAREGNAYISKVRIGADHIPLLIIATPIISLGKTRGVLIGELNIRGIWDIVDSIKFGETGRAYLIDQEGRVIAHPDKKIVFQNNAVISPKVPSAVLQGKSGAIEQKDENSRMWLVSYAPVEGLNWGLIISQLESEAMSFSKVMQHQSWLLIGLSLLATVLISFILARSIRRPIHHLIDGTNRLAKGDYGFSFRIGQRNEIGKLLFSFNRMARKLEKAQRMERLSFVGRAATAIAHELKNSLVLVKTFVQLLPERHQEEKFIKDFSKIIPRELETWNEMLRGIMEYSRNKDFSKELIDVNQMIENVFSLAELRVKQKDIELNLNMNSDIPRVFGNEEKLKQVVLNLVTNAIDATSTGGSITMATELVPMKDASGYEVELKVIDTGEGMSQEQVSRIFEPFFSTKKNGLGLGLAISQDIVKHHGGVIQVYLNKFETSFVVRLPVSTA